MKIALDFDGTYTADPKLWDEFISLCLERDHTVVFVTMRYKDTEDISGFLTAWGKSCFIIYTERKAKKLFCEENDIYFDIWIDDHPEWLFNNG